MIGLLALLAMAAGQTGIGVPAKVISGNITSADYPPGALRRGTSGLTKVRLVITTEGRATDCSLFQSSGDPELDTRVCWLATTRMRFSPALGNDGKPTAMNAILPVHWVLEPSIPPENLEE